ncbi:MULTISPECIES: hypothetical protein [unclassified Bradyrhizobium]|uniref:hypothetical protein n=1 Tax=unclassified Bradyrhizobium TaxID=2631580 RepID=UPI00247AA74E|nr:MULTISPECIES: hypothetical protein [unclassified Bradyrhizobium]WGS23372.1 hypothetical protein MTX22_18155 [Bradyrhizobium sp. ISRA463]WGS30385.1 hypothetical protein MTX19_15880 [Bradyrhizobium sp. ISRA464]
MVEKVSHTAVTASTAPFTLNGGTYHANLSGTVAHGIDTPELQQLVNGSFVSVDPPIRFLATEVGGSKAAKLAAGTYRWRIPNGHNVTVNIIAQ